MNEQIECRGVDVDAVRSVMWWFRAEFGAFFENASARAVFEPGAAFGVSRRENVLNVKVPNGFLEARPYFGEPLMRKVLVRAGLSHDYFTIDHYRVAEFFKSVANAWRPLGLSGEEKAVFLLRVDDFPSPHADSKKFSEFHRIASDHGISYLLGITPFLEREEEKQMTRDEIRLMMQWAESGAEIALHGFTHEKGKRPYRDEITGLSEAQLAESLETSIQFLSGAGIRPVAFIPPFNSVDAPSYSALKRHFPVITGGPESTRSFGLRIGPSFLNGALYVPSYRGVYNPTILDQFRLTAFDNVRMTVPVTIHWARDAKDRFRAFRKLAAKIKGKTGRWKDLAESAVPFMDDPARAAT